MKSFPESILGSTVSARSWLNELSGGLAGALAAFSIAVPLGALAFAPLGPALAGLGVVSALAGSVFGGLVVGLAGGNPILRSGPMTALCLIVNGLVATLLVIPAMNDVNAAGVPHAVPLVFACIALAGLMQILFGAMRLGHAIKYVPRPVLSGFRLGLAAIILVSQVPHLLGLEHPLAGYTRDTFVAAVLPWSLAVGAFTILTILAARRAGLGAIALFTGLIGGTLAHYAFLATRGAEQLGGTIGALPSAAGMVSMWRSLFEIAPAGIPGSALLTIGSTAITRTSAPRSKAFSRSKGSSRRSIFLHKSA
jgi:SulP family sulfate permease